MSHSTPDSMKKRMTKLNNRSIENIQIEVEENGHTTQSNLQIQCNPYQATNGIFHRTRTSNFTICMEIQKTSNSQSNLEKEEWNWRNQPA